jgi:hypothetical protein
MSFLKKISSMFSSPARSDERAYWIYARCNRCKEVLKARVDLYNDLSIDYDGDQMSYYCRKVLMGTSRCFQQIEVSLKFDQNRRLVNSQVVGGQLISREEYKQAVPEAN